MLYIYLIKSHLTDSTGDPLSLIELVTQLPSALIELITNPSLITMVQIILLLYILMALLL